MKIEEKALMNRNIKKGAIKQILKNIHNEKIPYCNRDFLNIVRNYTSITQVRHMMNNDLELNQIAIDCSNVETY